MNLRSKHMCNGTTRTFGVGLRIASPKHIKVLHVTRGKTVELHRDDDYAVEASKYPTERAFINTTKAYPRGDMLVIVRDIPQERDGKFTGRANVSGDLIDSEIDRLHDHILQLTEVVDRCMVVPHDGSVSTDAITAIDKIADTSKAVLVQTDELKQRAKMLEQSLVKAATKDKTMTANTKDVQANTAKVAAAVSELDCIVSNLHESLAAVDAKLVKAEAMSSAADKLSGVSIDGKVGSLLYHNGEKYVELPVGQPGEVLSVDGKQNLHWVKPSLEQFGLAPKKDAISKVECQKMIHKILLSHNKI